LAKKNKGIKNMITAFWIWMACGDTHSPVRGSSKSKFLSVLISLCCISQLSPPASAVPVATNPAFHVEPFADLASFGRLLAFGLHISSGENGFPAGLYVTSGPLADDRSDRLIRINPAGSMNLVLNGLVSNESLVFARGGYGDGMLITEPRNGRILRLLADGSLTPFSTGFTPPFGPAVLTYGPDPENPANEVLYATDFSSGNVRIVRPDGSTDNFASVSARAKSVVTDLTSIYGGAFVVGQFNFRANPDTGAIFTVSADGEAVNTLVGGLNDVQLIAAGPGGVFGENFFVPSEGRDFPDPVIGDGSVSILSPDGTLVPFLTNIDATSIAFDIAGVLGVPNAMYVTDIFAEPDGAFSKIYRVTFVPEQGGGALTMFAAMFTLLGCRLCFGPNSGKQRL